MYTLTREQKIANLEETLISKKRKVENLQSEIKNIEAKLTKLRNQKLGNLQNSFGVMSRSFTEK
jgi:septal ring factor EnvC (AmiA/AmiB activator)